MSPTWRPLEYGWLVKRTKHKAWCCLCRRKLYRGDFIVRTNKHGVRVLCEECDRKIDQAQQLLWKYSRLTK